MPIVRIVVTQLTSDISYTSQLTILIDSTRWTSSSGRENDKFTPIKGETLQNCDT